jgi:hypothetical protein
MKARIVKQAGSLMDRFYWCIRIDGDISSAVLKLDTMEYHRVNDTKNLSEYHTVSMVDHHRVKMFLEDIVGRINQEKYPFLEELHARNCSCHECISRRSS